MKDEKKSKNKIRKPVFAKKSLGQNFLVDRNYIDKIIFALNPNKEETIIEIGAGRGALTDRLVESGANIVAVELDRDLIPLLHEKFGKYENFTLVEQNALDINFAEIIQNPKSKIQNPKSVKLVANLPFYISTAILQKIIEQSAMFSELVLMLQREVVERITAVPGNKERGFLTILVEAEFNASKLFDVRPTAFMPVPKVWSSVVRLITKDFSNDTIVNKKLFREIVSLGFLQKRKTILNNLKNAAGILREKFESKGGIVQTLGKLNIKPIRRAETLTIAEWKALCDFLCD
jgi:16S rRNA (adenine1518-N6/adenine1519-N6)-dimethyltransferase